MPSRTNTQTHNSSTSTNSNAHSAPGSATAAHPLAPHSIGAVPSSPSSNGSLPTADDELSSSSTYAGLIRPKRSTMESSGVRRAQARQEQQEQHQQQRNSHSRYGSRNSNGRQANAKPPLVRSKSDGVRSSDAFISSGRELSRWGARHGFESHYQSEDIIAHLANNWHMYYTDRCHDSHGRPLNPLTSIEEWRMKDRLKTVAAAIAVCLNYGVEPPDQLRTTPGSFLLAWQDTTNPKAVENIGKAIVSQYEALAIRPRYKYYGDPTIEDTERMCATLRRSAKDERILLHYNGIGVPKPTTSGEIWVYNKGYTQYIPISLFDLQQWLQGPTMFVWDCSEAGNILANYHTAIEKHELEEQDAKAADPNYEKLNFGPYIHLAACAAKENLPTSPLIPTDVFTSCLTTPMEMALWFFVQQNPLKTNLTPERARKLPGRLQDRRTPLGELNWIFTAITDTIAWTTLPRDLFRQFFRQDLLVAALFRNFLLAQRIMSVYGCHPQSFPELPDARQHPLWASWDLAVDQALDQLPMLERKMAGEADYEYQTSSFFADQLTAFERYLCRGDAIQRKPPVQLPVVLQVLLSQHHRVRALVLLGRFLDLGPWAVQLALSIGIFPYVLKLLQSATPEVKPVMVFIWTRVLAVDTNCQQDLLKDNGYNYFATILKPPEGLPIVNTDDHKGMCAFILTMVCKDFKAGQLVCNQTDIMTSCLEHLRNPECKLLRQWSCLCISHLWKDLPEAKWRGIRENAPMRLAYLAKDKSCEVRCAMLHALTTFLGIPDLTTEVARIEESIAWTVLEMANDASPMVRKELLVFMSHFVLRYENRLLVAAFDHLREEKEYLYFPPPDGIVGGGLGTTGLRMSMQYVRPDNRGRTQDSDQDDTKRISENTVFMAFWKHILIMSVDPEREVQAHATIIVDYVHESLLNSPVGEQAQGLMSDIQRKQMLLLRNNTASPVVASTSGTRPASRGLASVAGATDSGLAIIALNNHTASFESRDGNNSVAGTDDTTPLAPPGLLRRTVSTIFSSFTGSDGSQPPSSPRPQSRPGTSHSQQAPMSPGLLRTGSTFQRGSIRNGWGLGVSGMTSSPGHVAAPPEDSERESTISPYNVAPEPVGPGYEGTSAEETAPAARLPLETTFLDWSTEFFREPQMRMLESEEPGSTEYNERLWRRVRNENSLRETQPQKAYAGTHKWNNQVGMINNGSQPSCMVFHQFEDHLAVADDSNTVQVWDWKRQELLNRFSNGNPQGSRISDMKYVNEDDLALLMAGSSDGVLRVYRHYESGKKIRLATAWRALTDMVPSNVHAGMVFDWLQVNGQVVVAGDVRVIRVWDVGSESATLEIPARSGSCVTSLTSDQMTGQIIVAGFGDGAVRVFDTRLRPADAMVRKWRDDADREWIKTVHMQRGGQRELLSAARDGKVKLWDIRREAPLHTIQTTSQTLRTASTHEHLPVFAVGTSARVVKVFNLDGRELSRMEPYSGFLQGRHSAPIAATAFHPHQMTLAGAARGDFHINLYSTSTERAYN